MRKEPKSSLEMRAAVELDMILIGVRGIREGNDYSPDAGVLKFLTSNHYVLARKSPRRYVITAKGMEFYDKKFKTTYNASLAKYRRQAKPRIDAIKRSEKITNRDLSLYINV